MRQPTFLTALLMVACGTTPTPIRTTAPDILEPVPISGASEEIALTRIVHSCHLIELGAHRVLTDPWFTESSQYKAGEPLGLDPTRLPRVDAIVASHAHYDHFDLEGLVAIGMRKDVPIVVPVGAGEEARAHGFTDVRELAPWEQTDVGGLRITAAPGAHGVVEITFVLQAEGGTVYFGGDTRLIPELDEIAARFPSIQLAVLSVNGLHALGEQQVMNAEEAARLTATLRAEVAVPMHYRFHGGWFTETFILSYDGDPQRFRAKVAELAPKTRVRILESGERLRLIPSASQPGPS